MAACIGFASKSEAADGRAHLTEHRQSVPFSEPFKPCVRGLKHSVAVAPTTENELQVGSKVHASGGHFVLTRVDKNSLYFSNPPGIMLDENVLRQMAIRLRSQGGLEGIQYIYSVGSSGQIGSVIDVDSDLSYGVSNRSLEALRENSYLKSEMNKENLIAVGGLIVDAGCGAKGLAVVALRKEGIENVVGIDISAQPTESNNSYLRREDMRKTSFPSGSVRRIFSSYSLFLYAHSDRALLKEVLDEFQRILEPDGVIYIAGVPKPELLKSIVSETDSLEWVDDYENGEIFGPTVTIRRR